MSRESESSQGQGHDQNGRVIVSSGSSESVIDTGEVRIEFARLTAGLFPELSDGTRPLFPVDEMWDLEEAGSGIDKLVWGRGKLDANPKSSDIGTRQSNAYRIVGDRVPTKPEKKNPKKSALDDVKPDSSNDVRDKVNDGTYRYIGDPDISQTKVDDMPHITPKQEKRLRKKLHKAASDARKAKEALAQKSEEEAQRLIDAQRAEQRKTEAAQEAEKAKKTRPDGSYRIADGEVLKTPKIDDAHRFIEISRRAKVFAERSATKVKDTFTVLAEPKTPPELTRRQKVASVIATTATAMVGPHLPIPNIGDAARPSKRPAAITAQAFPHTEIEGSLSPLGNSQTEKVEGSGNVEKPIVQETSKVTYPENIDPYTPEKYVQMPEIRGLLRFMTSEDIGEEGKGSNTTPPEERYGRPELIAGINTVAKAYQAKYKDSYLLFGDLNAPDHASHKDGIDVDIYLPNDGLRILKKDDSRREFTKKRAIAIGKMLIDTGMTDLIFYNDQEVIDEINNYATQKGIDIGVNGIMQKSGDNHNSHMHWRVNKVERTNDLQPILDRDPAIRQHIVEIARALKQEKILTPNVFAYALATMQVETAGKFLPVREGWFIDERTDNPLPPGTTGKSEARKRGYKGGENYYGRGDNQLTGLPQYEWASRRLGIDFVKNPDLVLVPWNSARIFAAYNVDRGTAALADQGKFVEARTTINGTDRDVEIAGNAEKYLTDVSMRKIYDEVKVG
ncbi:MAG TPA: penicillin-insensitive murein endopeptidase [Candidatus Limnocylindrales bacterium]|nr:penicillin-insensitive murein endopeptidase [Candidatus Limnocylindrales bacterium]